MAYNLRSRNTTIAKRPDETVLSPRKRARKGASLPQDCGDILRKSVARPLGPFESLFNAYPVVQSIVQNLSTPNVMSLCITTPHLWRLLAGNRTFHVFSNHYNCIDLRKPVGTLRQYLSRNTFPNFFTTEEDLKRLCSQYLDVSAITHLVLDGTEVTFDLLFMVAEKANIKLLSLKYCRKLSLEGINTLLDCPPRGGRHQDFYNNNPFIAAHLRFRSSETLLGDLKTLRVWFPHTSLHSYQSTNIFAREKDLGSSKNPMGLRPRLPPRGWLLRRCNHIHRYSSPLPREGHRPGCFPLSLSWNLHWLPERDDTMGVKPQQLFFQGPAHLQ